MPKCHSNFFNVRAKLHHCMYFELNSIGSFTSTLLPAKLKIDKVCLKLYFSNYTCSSLWKMWCFFKNSELHKNEPPKFFQHLKIKNKIVLDWKSTKITINYKASIWLLLNNRAISQQYRMFTIDLPKFVGEKKCYSISWCNQYLFTFKSSRICGCKVRWSPHW